ncbi:MAG: GDP-mannose 4,6-dehydratase [Bacteroidetes bacterium]|nr:GDP-mannose 4,6-dehydratase [Bacteroidota bacterium]
MKDYYQNKNVLITGGLGFIGSNLAHKLVEYGANVTIVDNLAPLYGGNVFNINGIENKVELVINDVRNSEIVYPLVEKSDVIFHMAAQVSYIDSLNMPFEDLDLNSRSTLNLLEASRKLNPKVKIVFSSSRMVYGKVNKSLVTEDCETNPLSLYGIHKLTSEKYLLMYYKDFSIPCTILRLTNPYGPRQQMKHSKYSLVGWFIRQAMEGKTISIYGDGQQLRDYIYVDDIVDAMIISAASKEAEGEVLNIGSGHSSKFCDMVSSVVKCVNKGDMKFIPWPENYEKIETGDISVDLSKLKKITSWSPANSLDEGIRKTYEYYKEHLTKYVK